MTFSSPCYRTAELECAARKMKDEVPGRWRPGPDREWTPFEAKIGGEIVIHLEAMPLAVTGMAIAADTGEPIAAGTIVARRPGWVDELAAGDLGDGGRFGLAWPACESEIELSIRSETFPMPEWVGLAVPRDPPRDLGRVSFQIPDNGVAGALKGAVPEY